MKNSLWHRRKTKAYQWDFHDEEGREQIHDWSKSRVRKNRGINKTYRGFLVYTFNLNTLNSFIQNFNFMVIIQMLLAGLSIYIFQHFEIYYDVSVSLFVSPIVFPLAFSINTDFQRREKVLEDLANFKSCGMLWYFCMREWKTAAGLDEEWINAAHSKLKSMLFHLREYLLTDRSDRRKVILLAMYEDISDASQLIERIRSSKLPANTSIVSRVIHLLQMMSLSFERLRVIREYRSPRSIRAFNKVLILLLPIILGPYFVYQALDKNGKIIHAWTPYYISILVSFVFSALQGVQDKLDDPFDGMSEDDINLEQIDEWTFTSLGATVNRTFKIGRFHVNVDHDDSKIQSRAASIVPSPLQMLEQTDYAIDLSRNKSLKKRVSIFKERPASIKRKDTFRQDSTTSTFEPALHPYADVLEKISGNTRILKGGAVRPVVNEASALDLDVLDIESKITVPDTKHVLIMSEEKKPKKPLALQSLFQNPNADIDVGHMKNNSKGVSFDENPTILSSPVTSGNYLNDTSPLLAEDNCCSNGSRFKLTHMQRITSSTSLSPTTSPRNSDSLMNQYSPSDHTILTVEESLDEGADEIEMTSSPEPNDEQGFVVISNTSLSNDLDMKENDVFM